MIELKDYDEKYYRVMKQLKYVEPKRNDDDKDKK